jgi:ACS family hexuronate transporter-like MFS transporter
MTFKIKNLRWWIVGMLTIVTVVNYLDRSCLAVTAPVLKKLYSINEQQFSYIIMAFQISYLLMQPATGRLIDWLNLRVGFAIAIFWYSAAQMLTAFASSWRSLALFRALLGAGEAGNFPGAIKTVSIWFKPRERTVATGVLNVGSSLGAMIAPPLVAFIILKGSWQAAFVITGIISAVWGLVWLLFYQPPEKNRFLRREELDEIQALARDEDSLDRPGKTGVWKTVLPQRNFWGIAIARFFSEPAWQFYVYWIPLYLATERNLDLKGIAYFAWLPFLAGDLGCLFGGVLSPLYIRMKLSVLNARKAAAVTSAVLMVTAIFIGSAPTAGWAIFFFCVGSFCHQSMSSTLLTLPADLFPKRAVATANGLTGPLAHLGGMLFTLTVGYVVVHIGYKPLFTCMALFDLAGAALLCILIRQSVGITANPRPIETRV